MSSQHLVTKDNPNRPLTSADVKGAKKVLVRVYADSAYPMFLELSDKQRLDLENIDNDSTRKVTLWYCQDYEFIEYREIPSDLDYVLVIGDIT